jgi:hypothetical protein
MNFLHLLSELEQVDPEVYSRLDSRRRVFKHLSGVGQRLSAAALPLFVSSVFSKAYGQTAGGLAQALRDILNFALKLEYLELYFYQQRTGLQGRISAVNYLALGKMAADEANHVTFLRSVIASLGGTPLTDPTSVQFDFSGGRGGTSGPFADYRTNPATYLALAQMLEDLGVRAYKGAAPQAAVMANKTVLTAALGIHGVEARHAAHIRSMRRGGVTSSNPSQSVPVIPYSVLPKSWISGTDNGGPLASSGAAVSAPVYGAGTSPTFPAEDNVLQAGLTLSGSSFPNTRGFPAAAFSEAFDEGLDAATVSTIARLFTVASSTLF